MYFLPWKENLKADFPQNFTFYPIMAFLLIIYLIPCIATSQILNMYLLLKYKHSGDAAELLLLELTVFTLFE
jgi:hypothetical protein